MQPGTRVTAAQSSLNRLKQEQARQGLGLRGDIAALAQRVEFYMDEAEADSTRGGMEAGRGGRPADELSRPL